MATPELDFFFPKGIANEHIIMLSFQPTEKVQGLEICNKLEAKGLILAAGAIDRTGITVIYTQPFEPPPQPQVSHLVIKGPGCYYLN